MRKALATTAALTIALTLSACGGGSGGGPTPEPAGPAYVNATNIEQIHVEGLSDNITIFDVERDGRTLTCTTKNSFRAGISCIPAVEEADRG